MEQKLIMQLLQQLYILNGMNGKNRAVVKLTPKVIYVAIYQNFWDDLDISETMNIPLGRYKTNTELKEAYNQTLYYISENSK